LDSDLPVFIFLTASLGLILCLVYSRLRAQARSELEPLRETLQSVSAEIDDLLSEKHYVRESQRKSAHARAAALLQDLTRLRWFSRLTTTDAEKRDQLQSFASASPALVADANEAFVASELDTYRAFFDKVETSPLTTAQRRSCVINEDNNLVLAGAGTGKTSTMMGRAGYLLAAGRAEPEQVLMLAFARKAAEEMQSRQEARLAPWLSDRTLKVKTFHALGLEIIGAVEGHRPDVSPLAEDEARLRKFVDTEIDRQCQEEGYGRKLLRYLRTEQFPYRNPFDFETHEQYLEYVRTNELRTLRGEKVQSFEEVVIANLLAAHGISYEYECRYKVQTSGPDYGQYKPDFFLPDYGIYIEHFALNQQGNPPPHFQKDYLDGIVWKRALHRRHNTVLIETYSHLKRAGRLEEHLLEKLAAAGIEIIPTNTSELLDELRELGAVRECSALLASFLVLFKQSHHQLDDLQAEAAKHIDSGRLRLLLELVAPILDAYEARLAEANEIDFGDMIRRAITYVEEDRYRSPYSHLMVDEFQDISNVRAQLLRALLKQRLETTLFAVGDDWQSIYRFTGSDVSLTSRFLDFFGATATTALDRTFRFNDQIGEVATQFVLRNPEQVRKTIVSKRRVNEPAVSLVRVSGYQEGLDLVLSAIAQRAEAEGNSDPTVLVLGRYNHVFSDERNPVSRHRSLRRHSLRVHYMTVHSAKGQEADYVVVLGLSRGKHGFPCEKPTDAFLEVLLPDAEEFQHAEERRLFYVAMTRARHRVYLIYDPAKASQFVLELDKRKNGYSLCRAEFEASCLASEIPHVPCPVCATGALVPQRGSYGPFVGCNSFPYCDFVDQPCASCGSIMDRVNGVRVCANPLCTSIEPLCPSCGGTMVKRKGPYSEFWGCTNYRTRAEFYCRGKVQLDRVRSPHSGLRN
jgi:DNA helicase IV